MPGILSEVIEEHENRSERRILAGLIAGTAIIFTVFCILAILNPQARGALIGGGVLMTLIVICALFGRNQPSGYFWKNFRDPAGFDHSVRQFNKANDKWNSNAEEYRKKK